MEQNKPKFLNVQQVISISSFLLYLFILAHVCAVTSAGNQDAAPELTDTNTDTSESSTYDQYSSPDSREDEPSEVNNLPAPNELSVVRLNDTTVVLRWEVPDSTQEHLQFFKIQYKSTRKPAEWKTDNREIPPTTRAYQINSLRPGSYQFVVSAVYVNDDNVSSEPFKYRLKARSKLRADELPEQQAPIIYWHEAKYDYFRFKWNYRPKERDVPYFGYLVYYRSAHTMSDFTIYSTMDESVEIAEVEPDTHYEAKVVSYNQVGISDFSETITIKTEPRPNSTASNNPTTQSHITFSTSTTTKRPIRDDQTSTTPTGVANEDTTPAVNIPTVKPNNVIVHSFGHSTNSSGINSFFSIVDRVLGNPVDTQLLTRCLTIMFFLLPMTCVFFILVCFLKKDKDRKESPPSSTNESMQFDLEINGYFKNSFPGVEKDFSTISPVNDGGHHGFVNNHPCINDFA